jgi:hypothetical protein
MRASSMFSVAVRLNAAIDAASSLPRFGTCVSNIIEFRAERDIEEEEEEEDAAEPVDKKVKSTSVDIDQFINTAQRKFLRMTKSSEISGWAAVFDRDKTETVTVRDVITIDETTKNAEQLLFDKAPIKEGTYGDVQAQETKVDPSVRNARDYLYSEGHFTCSEALIAHVKDIWRREMYPQDGIRVVPYKINCYGPDGMFAEHKDTPDLNMVGTFLLGLGATKRNDEIPPHLIVGGETWKNPSLGHCCCFYTDVPHQVQTNGCYRATLSFKIYCDAGTTRQEIPDMLLSTAKSTFPKNEPLGLLMSHKYSMHSKALKGFDSVMFNIVQQCGLYERIELVPVVIFTQGSSNEDDSIHMDTMTSDVYRLTDADLAYLMDEPDAQDPQPFDQEIDFYRISKGFQWKFDHQEAVEYTGNESQSENLESIYLNMALVAWPIRDAERIE